MPPLPTPTPLTTVSAPTVVSAAPGVVGTVPAHVAAAGAANTAMHAPKGKLAPTPPKTMQGEEVLAAYQDTSNPITRALGTGIGFIGGVAGFMMLPLDLLSGVGGWITKNVGKGIRWAGGDSFVGRSGAWITRKGEQIGAPRAFVWNEEHNISNLLPKAAEAMGMKAERIAAAEHAQRTLNHYIGDTAQFVADGAAKAASFADPLLQGRARTLTDRAFITQHLKLVPRLQHAETLLNTHADALGGHFTGASETSLKTLQSTMAELNQHLKTMPASAEAMQKATDLYTKANQHYNLLAENLGTPPSPEFKKAFKAVGKSIRALASPMENMQTHISKAGFWSDVPGAIKSVPEQMGSANLGRAALNTSILASSAFSVARTTHNIKHDLNTFERMVAAVEGKDPKDISLFHIVTTKMPDVLEHAWGHLKAKYGLEALIETIATGANLAFVFKGNMGLGSGGAIMATQFLAPQIGQAFVDQNPVIPMYEALEKMQATGQELPKDAYVAFLTAASPKAEKLGQYNRLVQAVAEEYATEKASPAAILKEIASGAFDQRARVQEEKFAAQVKEKAAVGTHTAKLLEQRAAPVASMTEPTKTTEAPTITQALPSAKITHVAEATRLEQPQARVVGGGNG